MEAGVDLIIYLLKIHLSQESRKFPLANLSRNLETGPRIIFRVMCLPGAVISSRSNKH